MGAFWCFLWLILGYIGDSLNEVIEAFSQSHPLKVWAAPPMCCIWGFCFPCMTPRVPQETDLLILRILMWQFILAAPIAAAIEITDLLSFRNHIRLARMETMSLLLA